MKKGASDNSYLLAVKIALILSYYNCTGAISFSDVLKDVEQSSHNSENSCCNPSKSVFDLIIPDCPVSVSNSTSVFSIAVMQCQKNLSYSFSPISSQLPSKIH